MSLMDKTAKYRFRVGVAQNREKAFRGTLLGTTVSSFSPIGPEMPECGQTQCHETGASRPRKKCRILTKPPKVPFGLVFRHTKKIQSLITLSDIGKKLFLTLGNIWRNPFFNIERYRENPFFNIAYNIE